MNWATNTKVRTENGVLDMNEGIYRPKYPPFLASTPSPMVTLPPSQTPDSSATLGTLPVSLPEVSARS